MHHRQRILLPIIFIFQLAFNLSISAGNWPTWRGPSGNGIAQEETAPLHWSTEKNVQWKTALPGPGNSSPVVWGDRVFITSSQDKGKRRSLVCFHRKNGKLLWQKDVRYERTETTHKTNPQCSASPTINGDVVAVHYGSAGSHAYDLNGKLLWKRTDLGTIDHIWGYSSSPVPYRNTFIQYVGPGTKVSIVALDSKTGKTIWQRQLPDAEAKKPDQFLGAWGTPLLRKNRTRDELILGLPKKILSIDPATGEDQWNCTGLGPLVYTNPLASGDMVFAMSGYHGAAIGVKVPAGASGDITSKRIWTSQKKPPQRIGSGIAVDQHIYILNEPGIATCIRMDNGEEVWKERVGKGNSWGSMSLVANRIYVTNTLGQTLVLAPSPKFKLLATNPLGEMTRGSPAFSDGKVFIRTYKHLWCIGE